MAALVEVNVPLVTRIWPPRPPLAWFPSVTMPVDRERSALNGHRSPRVVRADAHRTVDGCVAAGHDEAVGKRWIRVATARNGDAGGRNCAAIDAKKATLRVVGCQSRKTSGAGVNNQRGTASGVNGQITRGRETPAGDIELRATSSRC